MSVVGDMLREGREARGLTVNQIAEITKIRTDHIRALEEGNFGIFMAPVYVRGFVRSYATLIKLDVPQVLAALDVELKQIDKFNEQTSLSGEPKGFVDWLMLQLSKINWSIVLPVILFLVLIFGSIQVYRFYHKYKTRDVFSNVSNSIYTPNPQRYELFLPIPTNPQQR